jgi:hypothetical protein
MTAYAALAARRMDTLRRESLAPAAFAGEQLAAPDLLGRS